MNALQVSVFSLCLIFLATIIGSAFVFFCRKPLSDKRNAIVLGFSGGIRMAAAFFGLLLPSIEQSKERFPAMSFLPPLLGFLLGCSFLYLLDIFVPHFHKATGVEEGHKSALGENLKFFLAVTIHNIPEGLAVGFAAGLALKQNTDRALLSSCLSLAVGIAIQNVPEGAAVSLPLYGDGRKKGKSFLFGVLSGIVEPLVGILGLFLAQLSSITPWLLAFSSGARRYVVLDELLPEARKKGREHFGLWSFLLGFLLRRTLEILL